MNDITEGKNEESAPPCPKAVEKLLKMNCESVVRHVLYGEAIVLPKGWERRDFDDLLTNCELPQCSISNGTNAKNNAKNSILSKSQVKNQTFASQPRKYPCSSTNRKNHKRSKFFDADELFRNKHGPNDDRVNTRFGASSSSLSGEWNKIKARPFHGDITTPRSKHLDMNANSKRDIARQATCLASDLRACGSELKWNNIGRLLKSLNNEAATLNVALIYLDSSTSFVLDIKKKSTVADRNDAPFCIVIYSGTQNSTRLHLDDMNSNIFKITLWNSGKETRKLCNRLLDLILNHDMRVYVYDAKRTLKVILDNALSESALPSSSKTQNLHDPYVAGWLLDPDRCKSKPNFDVLMKVGNLISLSLQSSVALIF
mmetsp:Transcript_2534/g.3856  ORF Transcript_2534/g.3856 Transcript_2534/m.3856 type:complete len:372 (+) Transcript_2534:37-1152(+)